MFLDELKKHSGGSYDWLQDDGQPKARAQAKRERIGVDTNFDKQLTQNGKQLMIGKGIAEPFPAAEKPFEFKPEINKAQYTMGSNNKPLYSTAQMKSIADNPYNTEVKLFDNNYNNKSNNNVTKSQQDYILSKEHQQAAIDRIKDREEAPALTEEQEQEAANRLAQEPKFQAASNSESGVIVLNPNDYISKETKANYQKAYEDFVNYQPGKKPTTYQDLVKALDLIKQPLTPEEKEKQRKRRNGARIANAVSDGISALANLFSTMNYAPNSKQVVLSEEARKRWENLDDKYKNDLIKSYQILSNAMNADENTYNAAERLKLTQLKDRLEAATNAITAEQSIKAFPYKTASYRADARQAEAAADYYKSNALYADALNEAKVGKEKAAGDLSNTKAEEIEDLLPYKKNVLTSQATRNYASANLSNKRAANVGKSGGSGGKEILTLTTTDKYGQTISINATKAQMDEIGKQYNPWGEQGTDEAAIIKGLRDPATRSEMANNYNVKITVTGKKKPIKTFKQKVREKVPGKQSSLLVD